MRSLSSKTQLSLSLLISSSLTATIVALGADGAFAQVTINSTGTVTGTFTLPPANPNFNQSTTRVDTNAAGQYFRNGVLVYTAPNPGYVGTKADGTHYVDFRGIPVVSTNGTITSPVLTSGNLQPKKQTGQEGTTLFGTIQDEFVARGFWEGVVTDPKTGQQYQGVFEIRGQGPRYSDANGGTSPTVFDFGSEYNFGNNLPPTVPKPLPSFTIPAGGMPVKLQVKVPANAVLITPTPVPVPAPAPAPTASTPTPVTAPGTAPVTTPAPALAPISSGGSPTSGGTPSPSPSGANVPPSLFSRNDSTEVNHVVLESSATAATSCTPNQGSNSTSVSSSANEQTAGCSIELTTSEQPIGPRSRVLLR
ncbi:hypothetical protein H6F78_13495 [Coleofasciculus sp. FACHB-64]|uniref:hypothetical protein n=1 Tax=Cyanophyceae TaxID=3028117 RepID=UPI001688CCD0|nr:MULTISPECIES: hypothetical protein [unclassified Coleofasciculus]MBD1839655.1 hypothetical protein [Coleofasciculus sp. FACHB-501]MBD1891208.1 hypothetical protein [Coleofasciculus sp. FACHB-SPT9]MBD2046592.1 hypothetical protein [Coleofasciculus sp. FACHB-64]